jgi:hypothetical protein
VDRGERRELVEHFGRTRVPAVQDQVDAVEPPRDGRRALLPAAWSVGVGEYGDAH